MWEVLFGLLFGLCRGSGRSRDLRGLDRGLAFRGLRSDLDDGLLAGARNDRDDLARAGLGAHAAVLALLGIELCKVVHDVDRVELTGLFAHLAADAADFAGLRDELAHILAGAVDGDAAGLRQDVDDLLRAGVRAGAASDALVAVYLRYAVFHMDGVEFAGLDAVAQTDAAELAGAGAAEEVLDGGAGLVKLSFIRYLKLKNFMKNIRTPIHDHMRKNQGWEDSEVVFRFAIAQAFLVLLAVYSVR